MMINIEDEMNHWLKIKTFLETYLNRDIGPELIPVVILEVLEKQQKEIKEAKTDLFYTTRRANCNCINHDEFEELSEEADKLAKELGIKHDKY